MSHAVPAVLSSLLGIAVASSTLAQSTNVTYQGELKSGNAPANGPFDFRFTVFDDPAAGAPISVTSSHEDVPVADGLFTVEMNLGTTVFTGGARWLQVDVRPGGSTGAFEPLGPRQPLTATPFSLNTRGIFVNPTGTFVGIGRTSVVSIEEVFGIYRNTNSFGGMYVQTNSPGRPFYGYSEGGVVSAYHYFNGTDDTWRLNVSGDRVIVTNTGNVGVATATPAERLDVNGNARAAGFLYNAAQVRTLSVAGAAFVWTAASAPPTESPSSGLQFADSVSTATLHAPVDLPDGATITGVEFFVFDNSAGAFNVSLVSRPHGQFGSSALASVNSGNSAGMQTLSPAILHTVNNNTHAYFLRVHTTDWINPMGLFSARVTYTVNRPS